MLIFNCGGTLIKRYEAIGVSDFIQTYTNGTPVAITSSVTSTDASNCLIPTNTSSITFSGAGTGATYSWTKLPSTALTSTTNVQSGLTPGAYITQISGGNVCGAVTFLNVVHHNSPLIDAGTDITVCAGVSLTLGNPDLPTSNTYTWSNSSTGNTLMYTAISSATFTMTTTDGTCTISDEVIVTADPCTGSPNATAIISHTDADCSGNYANGLITVFPNPTYASVTADDGNYLYSFNPAFINGNFAGLTSFPLTPGTYTISVSATNYSGVYYSYSINPFFFQTKAITATTTISSSTQIAGEVHVKNSGVLNISGASVEFAPNSKIVVESGGVLNISNSSLQSMTSCAGTWAGIKIEPGGTLNLNSGTVINLNGTGGIFVDANSYSLAQFNFNQGASVHLGDPTTTIEIKGMLHIGANATFTYSGNGFVKFNNTTLFPSQNITADPGAAMVFQRNNTNQKALEITQESLYPPSQLSLFKIDKCKVELGAAARINPMGLSTQVVVSNSKIIGTGSNYSRGLILYGQPNVTINNNRFEYCSPGIYALLTFGGAPLTVSNCTFENCGGGIESHDKGVKLFNTKFYNCQTAWYSTAASFPSLAQNCIFGSAAKQNITGIDYFGGANGSLFLNKCKVNNNSTGIYHSGTTLKILCSEVKNNTADGIYLWQNGTLNMSTDLGGGNTDLGTNGDALNHFNIRLDNAKNIYLNNGFNNLSAGTSGNKCVSLGLGCLKAIAGTMSAGYDPCNVNDCSDYHIPANQNDWFDPVNTTPVSGRQYDVQTSYDCVPYTQREIIFDDYSPASLANCNVINNKPPVDHILANCPTCHNINTPDFVNVKLNDAVKAAMDKMELPGNGNNNKDAVKLFHQLIKYPIASPSEQERELLDIAYLNMQEALGNAFLNGEITEGMNVSVLADEVQKVIEVQDDILSRIPCDKNYHERLATNMEKAEALRLAGRRDLALQVFDYILTWVAPVDQPYVQRWRCITDAEQMLKDGSLVPDNFKSTVAACGTSSRLSFYQSGEGKFSDSKETLFKVIPNPSSGKFSFMLESFTQSNGKIQITDMLGKVVGTYEINSDSRTVAADLSTFENGIYFTTLILNGERIETKKIVLSK